MEKVNHYCYWIYETVIAPTMSSIHHHFPEVWYPYHEVWDIAECTNDHGNEYVLLVHINIRLRDDEPLDSDLGQKICDAVSDLAGQYYEDLDDGDYFIDIKKPWLMNSSLVLPITMQK